MAQKVHIVLEDDLDGSPATETVSFGLDGKTYEIDLNDKNAGKLRDALAQYVGAGRSVGGARRGGRKSAAARPTWGPAPARSATGPGPTATTCPTAAASRPTYGLLSTPPTDDTHEGLGALTRVPRPSSLRRPDRPCSLSAERVGAGVGTRTLSVGLRPCNPVDREASRTTNFQER